MTELTPLLFPVTIQVEADALASAILSGLAYGVSYWASDFEAHIPPEVVVSMTPEQHALRAGYGDVPFAAITPGCRVDLIEHGGFDDEDAHTKRSFGHVELAKAIEIIGTKYRWHLRTILDGGDADSGDVLLQLAALGGETVYG